MDKNEFEGLIRNINTIQSTHMASFQKIREAYPYFQANCVALAVSQSKKGISMSDNYLQLASAYVGNRKKLMAIIEKTEPIENLIPKHIYQQKRASTYIQNSIINTMTTKSKTEENLVKSRIYTREEIRKEILRRMDELSAKDFQSKKIYKDEVQELRKQTPPPILPSPETSKSEQEKPILSNDSQKEIEPSPPKIEPTRKNDIKIAEEKKVNNAPKPPANPAQKELSSIIQQRLAELETKSPARKPEIKAKPQENQAEIIKKRLEELSQKKK